MAIDTQTYKTKLKTALTDLTAELQTIGIHDPTNPKNWVATPAGVEHAEADPNVGADRVEEWDERRALIATLETRYNNIMRALQKIEAGTYGLCEVSGEEIETERLDVNPAARTCQKHMDQEN